MAGQWAAQRLGVYGSYLATKDANTRPSIALIAWRVRGSRLGRCSFHTGDTIIEIVPGLDASSIRTATSEASALGGTGSVGAADPAGPGTDAMRAEPQPGPQPFGVPAL
jgi:hypothetical protein